MQNVFFLKEALLTIDHNVTLVLLAQKQLSDAIPFAITTILTEENKNVILVSLTQKACDIMPLIPEKVRPQLRIIDIFPDEDTPCPGVLHASNASDFTSIQIGLAQADAELTGDKVIIIDALNVFALYNDAERLGKFMHLLSNKIRLEGKSALFFVIKSATDKPILDQFKEFSDKTFDYADLYISAISALME